MQSVLLAILSPPEAGARSVVHPDRSHHPHLPVHGLAAATPDRPSIPTADPCLLPCLWAWGFTLVGLLYLSQAGSFGAVLLSAMLIGMGSSVFHPESSRSPAWRPATSPVWPSLCSRSAAIWDRPSAPARGAHHRAEGTGAVRPGSRCSHSSGSSCSTSSAAGPATMPPASIGG